MVDKKIKDTITTTILKSRGFEHVGTWPFDNAKKLIDRIAANGWRIPQGINPKEYKPE